MERCRSGRTGTPGKRVLPQGDRGFESHPFRSVIPLSGKRGLCKFITLRQSVGRFNRKFVKIIIN